MTSLRGSAADLPDADRDEDDDGQVEPEERTKFVAMEHALSSVGRELRERREVFLVRRGSGMKILAKITRSIDRDAIVYGVVVEWGQEADVREVPRLQYREDSEEFIRDWEKYWRPALDDEKGGGGGTPTRRLVTSIKLLPGGGVDYLSEEGLADLIFATETGREDQFQSSSPKVSPSMRSKKKSTALVKEKHEHKEETGTDRIDEIMESLATKRQLKSRGRHLDADGELTRDNFLPFPPVAKRRSLFPPAPPRKEIGGSMMSRPKSSLRRHSDLALGPTATVDLSPPPDISTPKAESSRPLLGQATHGQNERELLEIKYTRRKIGKARREGQESNWTQDNVGAAPRISPTPLLNRDEDFASDASGDQFEKDKLEDAKDGGLNERDFDRKIIGGGNGGGVGPIDDVHEAPGESFDEANEVKPRRSSKKPDEKSVNIIIRTRKSSAKGEENDQAPNDTSEGDAGAKGKEDVLKAEPPTSGSDEGGSDEALAIILEEASGDSGSGDEGEKSASDDNDEADTVVQPPTSDEDDKAAIVIEAGGSESPDQGEESEQEKAKKEPKKKPAKKEPKKKQTKKETKKKPKQASKPKPKKPMKKFVVPDSSDTTENEASTNSDDEEHPSKVLVRVIKKEAKKGRDSAASVMKTDFGVSAANSNARLDRLEREVMDALGRLRGYFLVGGQPCYRVLADTEWQAPSFSSVRQPSPSLTLNSKTASRSSTSSSAWHRLLESSDEGQSDSESAQSDSLCRDEDDEDDENEDVARRDLSSLKRLINLYMENPN